MTHTQAVRPRTLLDALIAAFDDALRTPEGVAPPVAILWPDPDSQWQSVVARLRSSFPRVYTLGSYDPDTLVGPAVWLRCIVDRGLPDLAPPAGTVPVLYLPGVTRQALRAVEGCPPELQPLLELQFRGKVWHGTNNREWTAEAFLTSEAGLGLEMARDATTREALLRTLPLLADLDVTPLRGRRLDATDFDKLAVDDPVRDLLRWMNDPDGTRATLDGPRWPALRSMIRSQFQFDPEEEPPSAAADHLAGGGGPWDAVWQRFCENPRLYPGIPRLLRDPAVASGELPLDMSRRPTENDEAEGRLRRDLDRAGGLAHHEAGRLILELEKEHAPRRDWVWAEIGESPLARVLEPVARLASLGMAPVTGNTVEELVGRYAAEGWRCDAAALAALAAPLNSQDQAVVHAVVRVLYLPWLDDTARRLQDLAGTDPNCLNALVRSPAAERDCCLLFVDGLRFDVGGALHEALERRGLQSDLDHRLAPLPSVTPTAKPAAAPIAEEITGPAVTEDFCATLGEEQRPVTAQRLRDAMAAREIVVMASDECRVPVGSRGGWTEGGQLDELGHKLGLRLAGEIEREVERLADRIVALLDSGWSRVRVVTDHGWLLMPGGLPKVELPRFLTETRWARCAAVKGESSTTMPVWPWYWNRAVRIATPHGVACFVAGHEYAHGGVSLQELVTPVITVARGVEEAKPRISEVTWKRLRCHVVVNAAGPGTLVDVRTNWKEPGSTLVSTPKEPGPDGLVSFLIEDDEKEGTAVTIILLDRSGQVVDRKTTTVGEA